MTRPVPPHIFFIWCLGTGVSQYHLTYALHLFIGVEVRVFNLQTFLNMSYNDTQSSPHKHHSTIIKEWTAMDFSIQGTTNSAMQIWITTKGTITVHLPSSLSTLKYPHLEPNNSMEQSPSWEANSHSASQEIPCLLLNPKVHHHVHWSLPLVPLKPCIKFCNKPFFFLNKLLSPQPTTQAGSPALVGYLQLFIQYIQTYPPYQFLLLSTI
jgi:hypothetical protein